MCKLKMLTQNNHEEFRPSYFSFSSSGDLAKQVPFMQKLNSISQSVLLNRKKNIFAGNIKLSNIQTKSKLLNITFCIQMCRC